MAFGTAVMAAALSVVGNYFSSSFQAKQTLIQKQFEYRAQAYNAFLDNLDGTKAPVLNKLLEIGTLSVAAITDGQVQGSEDEATEFLKKNNLRNVYSQFYSSVGILRLHGTPQVQKHCDDILLMLSYASTSVDWSTYPKSIQESYKAINSKAVPDKDYIDLIDPKIDDADRVIVLMTSQMFKLLVDELRGELHSET